MLAMICAAAIVVWILLCCCLVPILVRGSSEFWLRSNGPQPNNEEAMEMEEINNGINVNRENTSFEQEMEQFNREMNQENTTYEI